MHPDQIRTLLLDDSPFDRERIKRAARKADMSLTIDEAQDLAGLQNALHTRKYDLVLIDYHLPGGDGLDALRGVLNSPFNQTAAKIMISGSGNADLAKTAMEVGCHDFLNKDWLKADDFKQSVERSLIHARQQQQADVVQQADVMHLKGMLESSLASTLTEVLRSEMPRHRRMYTPEQERNLDEEFSSLNEEAVAQQNLNAFMQKHV